MSPTSQAADCIFCKIVAGDIPCYKLYEDEHVISFLDVGPLSEGHALVIPRQHWVTLDQVPDEALAAVSRAAKRVASAVVAATGCAGWNLLQNNGKVAGQVVMHVHFHIIPRGAEDGLGYRWNAGKLEQADAQHIHAAILKHLS